MIACSQSFRPMRRNFGRHGFGLSTSRLHDGLHTRPTFNEEQVALNEKEPTCGAFVEPSDGLEPSTPSLPGNFARHAVRASSTAWGEVVFDSSSMSGRALTSASAPEAPVPICAGSLT